MAKTKISEYDSNPANNTDVNGVNLQEGCSPSGINNALREIMADLKSWQDGTSGDNTTVAGTLNVTGNLHLDGSAGTSGYYLKSQGTGVTPVWSAIGSMGTQESNNVNITGGSATGLSNLTTTNFTASGTATSSGTLAVTGGLTLDGAAGTAGQFLTSAGAGNTPTWGGVSLGTMASQNANNVNITGGSITGLTTLSTSGGTISATTLTATTTLGIGAGWTVVQSGTDLIFKYSGTNKMKIDSSGNLTVVGNVTAYGTV